ncbi:MAG TPA: acetyl-CoA carboxylase biotin carboxyl carrier protein subunit [Arachnia sp.]|nr:acetyl-CoA carboxylase biotin carboxyl carrier protein subunit [Arachnia sp.]HMT84868.1 acetyl-CoA carboxylase biotin carboxyl carrier protein subunit [Arachnia sp.]
MRRYTITVNDKALVLDVEAVGANLFRVQLDGRLIDVTLDDHRDLTHSPVTPGLTPRPSVAPDSSAGTPPPPAAASAPRRATAAPAAGPTTGAPSRDKLTAPMPGVVLSVETSVGATVARGEPLVKLEAMKMVNELRAPRDGMVAEIYVSEGASVKYGETLVRLEAAPQARTPQARTQ